MEQVVLTGMVLSTSPIGEYDKRVVILTREQGKIAAFARGARRPASALSGTVVPFAFGEFTVHIGRNAFTIQSVRIDCYFSELQKDMGKTCYGSYFLEVADYYGKEGEEEGELLKLLYQTLRALSNEKIPDRLIRYIFELKALCISGEAPQVFQCVCCGSKERPAVFSVKQGGLVCEECDAGVRDGVRLEQSTLYCMQYIESSRIKNLYTFVVSAEVLEEFAVVMQDYMKQYVDRQFKSLEILRILCQ